GGEGVSVSKNVFLLESGSARGSLAIHNHAPEPELPPFGFCFERMNLAMEPPGDVEDLSPIDGGKQDRHLVPGGIFKNPADALGCARTILKKSDDRVRIKDEATQLTTGGCSHTFFLSRS